MTDAADATLVTPEAKASPPHTSPAATLSAVAFPEGASWGLLLGAAPPAAGSGGAAPAGSAPAPADESAAAAWPGGPARRS